MNPSGRLAGASHKDRGLSDLQKQVEINNDEISVKKQETVDKRKKIKALREERARREAALAQQQQNHTSSAISNHDARIRQLKEQLARQQEQIRHIRANPNMTEKVSEHLEILSSSLKDKKHILRDTTSIVEVLAAQLANSYSQNGNKRSIETLLQPTLQNLNNYLVQEDQRLQQTRNILDKRRQSTERLDSQINEMKSTLSKPNASGEFTTTPGASAQVGPWLHRHPIPAIPTSISKRVDVPQSSTSSDNSSNIRAPSPGGLTGKGEPSRLSMPGGISKTQLPSYSDIQRTRGMFGLKSASEPNAAAGGNAGGNFMVNLPTSIQHSYLDELKAKHYPTPLKKRSSISESLEGLSSRHINTRAGYLFNRQYKSPDTHHPEREKKEPPPYPGGNNTRLPHPRLLISPHLSQIDSENDSSNSSPNNSLNKEQQEKAKQISDQARYDQAQRNARLSRNPPLAEIDETTYTASDLRRKFEAKTEKSNPAQEPPGRGPPPATPPRISSAAASNNSGSQHPVDLAIQRSQARHAVQRSPSPPRSPPQVGVVAPMQKAPKTAPKILRPTRSSHFPEVAPEEQYKSGHGRSVVFDPFALLLDASLEGEFEQVRAVMKKVADPSRANDEGITALHNAVCAGHMKIVEFLVHAGVDINAADSDGWTPLHCAASCNNYPMVKFLVERGACIFAQTISDRGTAADKCEELDEGYVQCSEYLFGIQEKMGQVQKGHVYALYDYDGCGEAGIRRPDEISFEKGDLFTILQKTETGRECESEWWLARKNDEEGLVPRNFLGMWPRIQPK